MRTINYDRLIPRGDGTYEIPVDAVGRLAHGVFPSWWPDQEKRLAALVLRDGSNCRYCGIELDRTSYTVDHVIPRKLKGSSLIANLVLACRSCNCRKGAKLDECWGNELGLEA